VDIQGYFRKLGALLVAVTISGWAVQANAAHLGWESSCSTTGSGTLLCTWDAPLAAGDADGNVAGSAEFSVSGGTLTILLSALAPADGNVVNKPIEVLTGITFDSVLTLTGDAAIIAAGSMLVNPDDAVTTNISQYWAFAELTNEVWGDYGFATMGGESPYCTGECFGNGDLLAPGGQVNGMGYGLVPDGAGANVLSNPLKNGGPFVQYQLVLTANISGSGDLGIGHVVPIYGTDGTPPMPEPDAALLFGIGALVVARAIRRSKLTASTKSPATA
jgi:hypothetical protein